MTTARRRSSSSLFSVVIAISLSLFLLLAALPSEAKKKNDRKTPAPAPSPSLAETAAAALAAVTSRAEAAAAAAAARALDDLPPGPKGTKPHQLQFLGTHRSYRIAPSSSSAQATAFLRSKDGAEALAAAVAAAGEKKSSLSPSTLLSQVLSPVTREPLAEQAEKGIRAFHLDAWADDPEKPGIYSNGWAAPKLGGSSTGGDRRGRGDKESSDATRALMRSKGFKVFSDPDFDGLSVCPTLSICLGDLKGWSDASPGHSPVVVFVEPRDDPLFKGSDVARVRKGADAARTAPNGTEGDAAATAAVGTSPPSQVTFDEMLSELTLSPGPALLSTPPKIDAAQLVSLDAEIRTALGGGPGGTKNETGTAASTLFAPEDLRAAANLTSGSLLARNVLSRGGRGWPDVDSLRGRILVVVVGRHASLYADTMAKTKRGGGAGGRQAAFAAAPSQDGAGPDTLFLDLAPKAVAVDAAGAPVAPAPAKVLSKWEDAISTAARSAFLVRSSADFAGAEAAAFSPSSSSSSEAPPSSRAESVLRSGATFVMTDYPYFAPDPTTGYSVALKRGGGAGNGDVGKKAVALRCNPATATKNPSSLSFSEVGCAVVPPPQPVTPPPSSTAAAAKATKAAVGGEHSSGSDASSSAAVGGEPELLPPPNGDGPRPEDPYYQGDGNLLVVSADPAATPSAAPPVAKPTLLAPAPAVSKAAAVKSPSSSVAGAAAAAAVSTAARPKNEAEGAASVASKGTSTATAATAVPPAKAAAPPVFAPVAAEEAPAVAAARPKATWASPVDTSSPDGPLLDSDAVASVVPPQLAASDDEKAGATASAAAAAAPAAASPDDDAAPPPPRPKRPGYATPADAVIERPSTTSLPPTLPSRRPGASSPADAPDDSAAPAAPRRRFLDPNAAPEAGPSFIPLAPSKIESGDSPDGSAAAKARGTATTATAAAAGVPAAPVVAPAAAAASSRRVSATSAAEGTEEAAAPAATKTRNAVPANEEANSHTGDGRDALAMPSLLP